MRLKSKKSSDHISKGDIIRTCGRQKRNKKTCKMKT